MLSVYSSGFFKKLPKEPKKGYSDGPVVTGDRTRTGPRVGPTCGYGADSYWDKSAPWADFNSFSLFKANALVSNDSVNLNPRSKFNCSPLLANSLCELRHS